MSKINKAAILTLILSVVSTLAPAAASAEQSDVTVGKGSIVSKRVWLSAYSRGIAHQIRIKEIKARQAK